MEKNLIIIFLIKSILCQIPSPTRLVVEVERDEQISKEQPIQSNQEFQNLNQNNFLPNDFYQSALNNYFPPSNQFPTFNNYYPPSNSYPTWNFCIPPQLSPTYYVCPEPFYFFQYEPLLISNTDADDRKARLNKFSEYFYAQPYPPNHPIHSQPPPSQAYPKPPSPYPPPPQPPPGGFQSPFPPFFPSNPPVMPHPPKQEIPESQAQQGDKTNSTVQSLRLLDGPVWEILKQTYDKCCPLNRNRLKPIQTRDEISLYQRLFNSYGKFNNTLQGQGIYGIIENFDVFQSMDSNAINPASVQILSSSGFYLINRREINGASTTTPIALSILINMWPLFVIIGLANAYVGVFIWLLDKTLNTGNFSPKFLQGAIEGSWWSYLLFVTNGFTPYVDLKKLIQRVFTILWILVSLVIIIIFVGMFTTAMTVYAINGQSLSEKVIGFNKYSVDRPWLDLENANSVEYDDSREMFKDLDDLKLDYIALDHVYANFYSKIITQRFYATRFIPRKRSFNVALRGFNPDQISCFHTIAGILSQQWLKANLSSNENKIVDKGKYFSITDELLFPQRNVILLSAVGILVMIFVIGITWQIACMDDSLLLKFLGRRTGGFRFGRGRRAAGGRNAGRSVSFDTNIRGPRNVPAAGSGSATGGVRNLVDTARGAIGSGGRGSGGGGGGGLLESLSNTVSGIGNILSFRPSPHNDIDDNTERSVKFNPLVHYYNENYNFDEDDEDRYPQTKDKYRPLHDQQPLSTSTVAETLPQTYKYYRVNDKGFEEVIKEESLPLRSNSNSHSQKQHYSQQQQQQHHQNQIQLIQQSADDLSNISTQIIKVPNFSTISIITPPSQRRDDKFVQTNDGETSFATDVTGFYQHLRPSIKSNVVNADLNNSQLKYKKIINFHKGIVLKPSNSTSNLFNHESNTDDTFIDTAHIMANTQDNLSYVSNPNYNPNIKVTVINPATCQNNNNDDDASISTSSNSSNNTHCEINNPKHTASIISNNSALVAGLARNESFYLTEFANVKL